MLKISIVTPSYNQCQFLEQTILSVVDQKNIDLEYLLIDGMSTDASLEIINRHQNQINYWVSEQDKNQTQAINKGLLRASGDVVNWLNSDDILVEGALQKVIEAFNRFPNADFIFGDTYVIDPGGNQRHEIKTVPFNKMVLIYGGNMCAQPSIFFRKSVLEKIGYLNENLAYGMDYEFWLRAVKSGCVFQHIPEPLSKFRIHPASKSVRHHNLIKQEYFMSYWEHFGNVKRAPTRFDRLLYKEKKIFFRVYRILLLMFHRKSFNLFGYARAVKRLESE